jgi:hypothetical protein
MFRRWSQVTWQREGWALPNLTGGFERTWLVELNELSKGFYQAPDDDSLSV